MTMHEYTGILTLLTPALPAATALAVVLLPSAWPVLRVLAPFAAMPAFALALVGAEGFVTTVPWLLQETDLGLDRIGRTFLGFTSALWIAAAWYAIRAIGGDTHERRFHAFFLASMAANFGLILARDVPTFYVCFAVMGFASAGLVLHRNDAQATRAGSVYIALAVVGETLILAGLAYLVARSGTTDIAALHTFHASTPTLVCLALGFGIKAGALTTHFWLPLAHPAAPVPASAVLSGAMIKAGLLGWLRFLPLGAFAVPTIGLTFVFAGATAALLGAAAGCSQRNPKTVLAYSSVSQMGIICVGVGIGLYAPDAWPAILPAILVYATHHALAKGSLFLGLEPARSDHGRLATIAVWIAILVPAAALAGAPFTSGAVAKLALKSNLEFLPGAWGATLAVALPLAAAGTTAMMFRVLWLLWNVPRTARTSDAGLRLPWLFSVGAVVLGVWLLPGTWELLAKSLTPEKIWTATWPLLAGAAIASIPVVVRRRFERSPEIPAGDVLVLAERLIGGEMRIERVTALQAGTARCVFALRALASRTARRAARLLQIAETRLSAWPVAGVALVATVAAIWLAGSG